MEASDIISKIKNCIKGAHEFSEAFGKSTSIHKDIIINNLTNISSTDIHIALLEMKEKGEIEILANNPDVILLSEDFEY